MARGTLLKVKAEIERVALLRRRQPIGAALAADEVVRAAIVELVNNGEPGQAWEIRVGPRIGTALVQATVNDLFKGREAAVTFVAELRKSGLEFRSGAGEVLELSEESVAEVFRRLMSLDATLTAWSATRARGAENERLGAAMAAEVSLDAARLSFLAGESPRYSFAMDELVAYLLQLRLHERHQHLDPQRGRALLKEVAAL